jgi:hypothetical protein
MILPRCGWKAIGKTGMNEFMFRAMFSGTS